MSVQTVRVVAFSGLAAVLVALAGCGTEPSPVPSPTPPAVPAASISATGGGALVIHPSANRTFVAAMETPIRITETGGGSADWGFARMSLSLAGREVERAEMTANDLRAAGFGRIGANSNAVNRVIFRFNADDFDTVDMTLGFTDVKDGRQFNVVLPANAFTDVLVDFRPLKLERAPNPL